MTQKAIYKQGSVAETLRRLGQCLELVPMDPHFHNVSVGLYVKDGLCTVHSFSRAEGIGDRLREIRDQMVALGGVSPVEGSGNQFVFPCGQIHERPVRFLLTQAVGKSAEFAHPIGDMSIKDSRSDLMLYVNGHDGDGQYVYQVSAEGEHKNPALRLRMVVAGFLRYGEMNKVADAEIAFSCGQRHDPLMRLLLPYSRNISAVETMMDAEALRGQMTTGTLGFTPQV
ncbi:MAG: hypothetical protein QF368_03300 [SAR202 cluster bacterium]|jgi:hypothetical protein|nr:hypothetical protein [SAR202 cluster bacterium]